MEQLKTPVGNILRHSAMKKKYILTDQANAGAQILQLQLTQINAIEPDGSCLNSYSLSNSFTNVLLPEPVEPTIAIVLPAGIRRKI